MGKLLSSILVIAILLITGFFWTNQSAILKHRNQIFCDDLQFGMKQEEVLSSLANFGEFDYNKSSFGDSYFEIYMSFKDPKVAGQKTYILSFQNEVYTGVSVIKILDNVDSVCN